MRASNNTYQVYCSQCQNKILGPNTFCFYKQDANIHLIIKPNKLGVEIPFTNIPIHCIVDSPFIKYETGLSVRVNPKQGANSKLSPYKVYCKKGCMENLGGLFYLGPEKEPVYCLSAANRKVQGCIIKPFTGNSHSDGLGWAKSYHPFLGSILGTRGFEDFYYGDEEIPKNVDIIPSQAIAHPTKAKILYNTLNKRDQTIQNLEEINVRELTTLYPRGYQLECFYTALLKNTLICLPTGTGKSLISYMFVRRMQDLNKRKLCVYLGPK